MSKSVFAGFIASAFFAAFSASQLPATDNRELEMRKEMVVRAQNYLFSIQKEGVLGDARQKTVTPLFVLASLSSGYLPGHPEHGSAIKAASEWVLRNSSGAFLGGDEEPYTDHAFATLMLMELVGTAGNVKLDTDLYARARQSVEYALGLQNKGIDPQYYGGWRRSDKTRVNDRMLSAWYLYLLRATDLCGIEVPENSVTRAVEFVSASQKFEARDKPEELGGFSVDAEGLTVRSTTAAGLAVLALFDSENEKAISLARDWFVRHPVRWYGPNFYEMNFFAVSGLYRTKHLDGGKAFRQYYNRLIQVLKERQEPDGSFPFPSGHGAPVLAMGNGYSTALAILILNIDRGVIPMAK